jgi:hypothetical protein
LRRQKCDKEGNREIVKAILTPENKITAHVECKIRSDTIKSGCKLNYLNVLHNTSENILEKQDK